MVIATCTSASGPRKSTPTCVSQHSYHWTIICRTTLSDRLKWNISTPYIRTVSNSESALLERLAARSSPPVAVSSCPAADDPSRSPPLMLPLSGQQASPAGQWRRPRWRSFTPARTWNHPNPQWRVSSFLIHKATSPSAQWEECLLVI